MDKNIIACVFFSCVQVIDDIKEAFLSPRNKVDAVEGHRETRAGDKGRRVHRYVEPFDEVATKQREST